MSKVMAIPSLAGVAKDIAERAGPIVIRILAANMRTETPVGKTGRLKRSIRSRVFKTGDELGRVSLGIGVKGPRSYAHLVVGGTDPHSLAPGSGKYGWGKKGSAGERTSKAKWATSKRKWGWHPGTAPNPVLDRTLTRSDVQIARDIETAAHQALEKAVARAK